MKKIELIQSQIELYFEIPTLLLDDDLKTEQFRNEHCLFLAHQRYLGSDFSKLLIENGSSNILYYAKDSLEMEFAILNLEDEWLQIGPFVNQAWNDERCEVLLASLGIEKSQFLSYKLYRCSYQIVDIEAVQKMINAIIGAASKKKAFVPIWEVKENFSKKPSHQDEVKKSAVDYQVIERRYNIENKFIEMIQIGDDLKALEFWYKMKELSDGIVTINQPKIAALVGTSIIRTMCRQAVKSTGIHFMQLHAITQKYSQNVQNDTSNTEKWTREFIIDICRAVRENTTSNYSFHIRQTISYININLSEPISIDEIANEVNISVSHLSRLFKKEIGENISNYISQKRTEKACLMLKFSDLSVAEISQYVGYLDNNYFVKVFKKNHGMTPSLYRKEFKL